jgi:hypothetical protein
VHQKEGNIRRHSELAEWVEPKFFTIMCLDNNITCKREFFEELYKEKMKKFPRHAIIFRQGVDKFHVDRDIVSMFIKMNAQHLTIACDRASEIEAAKKCIELLKPMNKRIYVYCLVKELSDLHTVVELANYDSRVFPYVMPYKPLNAEERQQKCKEIIYARYKINFYHAFYHLRKAGMLNYETLIKPIKETKHIRAEAFEKGVDF